MIYISLGSNLGDREEHIRFGIREISKCCSHACCSSFYSTSAREDPDQPDFINAVVACQSELGPEKLLEVLLLIERQDGRIRNNARRYGPRTLDLDIILYDDLIIDTGDLVVPHPKMTDRAFVLVPLLELDPDIIHPSSGILCREYLEKVKDQTVSKADG